MTPITAVDAIGAGQPVLNSLGVAPAASPPAAVAGFGEVLAAGVRGVESKIATADDLVRRFTLDGDVPIHQVTYALEEAKLSVELAMQVRGRLLDGYRDIMNMQL
jgi:flagellar hook-basal body complex protein FliE